MNILSLMSFRGKPAHILALGIAFLTFSLVAQSPTADDNLSQAKNYLPASPEVSSLFKFTETPVSLYTGRPEISIPIFPLTSGSLSAPISLMYDASGVRLDEVPGPVGLKWALMAGGMISRRTRGQVDEAFPEGIMYKRTQLDAYLSNCQSSYGSSCVDYILDAIKGRYDTEPDLFHVQAPGLSCSFFYTDNQTFVTQPYQPIRIEHTVLNDTLTSFTLTRPDGTRYMFQALEKTTDLSADYNGGDIPVFTTTFYSAWHLTQMISNDQKDTISFEYSTYEQVMRARNSETKRLFSEGVIKIGPDRGRTNYRCGPSAYTNKAVVTRTVSARLEKIRSRMYTVDFSYINRADLINWETGQSQGYMLAAIDVSTHDGTPIKGFDFAYQMFSSRNYLMSLTERAGNLSLAHLFTYHNPAGLPLPIWHRVPSVNPNVAVHTVSSALYGQDLWGFYNGETQNTSPFPSMILPKIPSAGYQYVKLGNRDVNPITTQYGSLTKITYPTGGFTEFTYENHEFGRIAGAINNTTGTTGSIGNGHIRYKRGPLVQSSLQTDQTPIHVKNFRIGGNTVSGGILCKVRLTGHIPRTNTFEPIGGVSIGLTGSSNAFYQVPVPNGTAPFYAFDETIILETGKDYTLTAEGGSTFANFITNVTISYDSILNTQSEIGGGLRLKSMRISDGNGTNPDIIKHYQYTLDTLAGFGQTEPPSSGILNHIPVFSYFHFESDCQYFLIYSTNREFLGSSNWGSIGYRRVIETMHGGENGRIVHDFSTSVDYRDEFVCQSPTGGYEINLNGFGLEIQDPCAYTIGPKVDNAWRRGDLTKQTMYDSAGNVVKEVKHTYAFSDDLTPSNLNVASLNQDIPSLYIHNLPLSGLLQGIFTQYFLPVRFKALVKTEESTYLSSNLSSVGVPSIPLTNTTEYFYDRPSHVQMTRQQMTGSGGIVYETHIKYAPDYEPTLNTGPNANITIQHLLDKHMLFTPIEQKQLRAGQVVSGSISTFQNVNPAASSAAEMVIKPTEVYVAEITQPVDSSVYQPAEAQTGGTYHQYLPGYQIANQDWYKIRAKYTFDPIGLLATEQLNGGSLNAILWNENQQPVAMAINTAPDQIAYTSFESLENGLNSSSDGNWTIDGWGRDGTHAQTGQTAFWLEGSNKVTSQSLPAGDYILSFWHRETGFGGVDIKVNNSPVSGLAPQVASFQMHYYQTTLSIPANGVISLTGNQDVRIDELRLRPVGSQMKTYCYDQAYRVHSMTDVNNRSTYFEYDDLNRLHWVKDQDGHFVQKHDYQFHTQN